LGVFFSLFLAGALIGNLNSSQKFKGILVT
jgi:hypothetical protein